MGSRAEFTLESAHTTMSGVRLQSGHIAKRNRVLERVLCADGPEGGETSEKTVRLHTHRSFRARAHGWPNARLVRGWHERSHSTGTRVALDPRKRVLVACREREHTPHFTTHTRARARGGGGGGGARGGAQPSQRHRRLRACVRAPHQNAIPTPAAAAAATPAAATAAAATAAAATAAAAAQRRDTIVLARGYRSNDAVQ